MPDRAKLEAPVTERQPFYVHCRDCSHEWVSFYLPLTMDKKGMRLLKASGKSPCPMCAGTTVYVGRARLAGDAQ